MSDTAARTERAGYAAAAVLVVLVGAAFHLVKLATLPHGLFHDEAYNLLDEATISWRHTPVFFTANEGREALYFYWQHLFVLALGTSTFATRLPSAFLSIAEVALEVAVMRRLFGTRVGLLSGAVLATLYLFVQDGRLGLRFTSLPLVVLLAMLALWTAVRGGRLRAFAWAGAIIGLGAYTYVAARMLPVVAGLFTAYGLATRPRRWRVWLAGIALAAAVSAAIATPLAIAVFRQSAGTERLGETAIIRPGRTPLQNALAVAANAVTYAKSYSVLGDVQWLSNIRGRPVFDPVMGAWFYAGLAVLVLGLGGRSRMAPDHRGSSEGASAGGARTAPGRGGNSPVASAPTTIDAAATRGVRVLSDQQAAGAAGGLLIRQDACILCLITFVAMYVPGLLTTEAPYFQRVYGTVPIVALAPALAMDWIWRTAPRGGWRWAAVAAVVLSLAVQALSTGRDFFTVFARAKESAFDLGSGSTAIAEYLRAERPDGAIYISTYDDVVPKALAPSQIAAAHWFHAREVLPFPTDPRRPAYYFFDFTDPSPVEAELRSVATPILAATDRNVGVEVAHGYRIDPGRSLGELLPASPSGTFGGALEITGARIAHDSAAPGTIEVELGLRAVRDSPGYLSISVRAVDGAGTVWASRDGVGEDLSRWRAGQAALSLHPLQLPAGTPPGTLTIVASVYQVSTLQQLALADGGRQLTLGTVTLGRLVPPANGAALPAHRTLDLPLGSTARIIGTEPFVAAPKQGDAWRLGVLWQCIQPGSPGTRLDVDLVDGAGKVVGRLDPSGGLAAPAPGGCASGDVALDRRVVRIGARWPAGPTEVRATLRGPAGDVVAQQAIASISVQPLARQTTAPSPAVPLNLRFADGVLLVGVSGEQAQGGAGTAVRLVWRAMGEPQRDRTVFVHLLDPTGAVLAQHDSPPAGGAWPLTSWMAGQVVDDVHPLPVAPGSVPPGSLLEIGMYDPATGERLPIAQPGPADVRDDAVRIPWSSLFR